MMEKLKAIYRAEKFEQDDQVTMTVGYILNTAYKEVADLEDWDHVIDTKVTIEPEYLDAVRETKTQVTRFRLADSTSEVIDSLTRVFSEELGLKCQVGFTVKQILKAAILLRKEA